MNAQERHVIAKHTVFSEELLKLPTEEARIAAVMKAWKEGRMKWIAPATYELLTANDPHTLPPHQR